MPGTGATTSRSAAQADLPAVQARRTTTFTPTTSFADITLDTTDVENDASLLEHDNTNTEQIDIKETGEYLISFMAVWQPVGDANVDFRVRKNGSTTVPGSPTQTHSSGDANDHNIAHTIVATLASGDFITLQASVSVASGILAAGTVFNVARLRGTKGNKGAQGAGGASVPIQGLVPSNGTDADHDINISVGVGTSNDDKVLELTSAFTKQLDEVFAAGTAAGGNFVDTGSPAAIQADQTYHIFLIRKDSDGSIDAGFDTSVVAANIPAGYTSFKRIGSVLTDEDANILAFSAIETAGGGIEVLWLSPPLDVDATTSTTAVSHTLSVPIGYKVEARMNVLVDEDLTYFSSLDVNDEAPSVSDAPLATLGFMKESQEQIFIRTNISAQIRERSDTGGQDLRIATLGWTDARRD